MYNKFFHLIILISVLTLKSQAQMGFTVYPSEYQVKAKYLYNFTRFVDWPDQTFSHSDTPYIIGILGEDPFGIDLDKTVEGKKIKGRSFIVKRFKQIDDLKFCHILYIGLTDQSKSIQVIEKIKGSNILTVGDIKNFAHNGGIINFITKDKKIRFEINVQAAKETGIHISSKLLKQSNIIENQQPKI